MEEIKGKIYKILDQGSVELVDWMGTDSDIVKACRISTGASTKTPLEDERLLCYIIEHSHTSPLEMCEIKLKLVMPIFIARQWHRHRTASINEFSGRYSEMPDIAYVPDEFRKQSKVNHQGSDGTFDDEHRDLYKNAVVSQNNSTFDLYHHFLEQGMSREMARIILPLSTYTSFFWKIDLHNLLKFLKLRMDPTAQKEIRDYADKIWEIVKVWVPVTAKAFERYHLNHTTFCQEETKLLQSLLQKIPRNELDQLLEQSSLKKRSKDKFLTLLNTSQ
jgi:thymidylate synthase (FAD)